MVARDWWGWGWGMGLRANGGRGFPFYNDVELDSNVDSLNAIELCMLNKDNGIFYILCIHHNFEMIKNGVKTNQGDLFKKTGGTSVWLVRASETY